jgi:hypothetical protein
MLNGDLPHRKITGITGREATAERERGRRNETVGLPQCPAALGKLAAPLPRPPALDDAQRDDSEPCEQVPRGIVLRWSKSSNRLLHIDGAHVGSVPSLAETEKPPPRIRSAAEQVDQHGGVEEEPGH